jgi:predicted RNA polymerase sigma factor
MTAMGEPTPDAASVAAAVADAHRRGWAYVLAATVRVTRDLDLAEECVQDAYAKALSDWAAGGIPGKPAAWLTQVARRRALDLRRRDTTLRTKLPLLVDDRSTTASATGRHPTPTPSRTRSATTGCG